MTREQVVELMPLAAAFTMALTAGGYNHYIHRNWILAEADRSMELSSEMRKIVVDFCSASYRRLALLASIVLSLVQIVVRAATSSNWTMTVLVATVLLLVLWRFATRWGLEAVAKDGIRWWHPIRLLALALPIAGALLVLCEHPAAKQPGVP